MEGKKEIYKALFKAMEKMGVAIKDSKNPFFKNNYADLNSVMSACKSILFEQGIMILQPVCRDENGDFIKTQLIHIESGETIESKQSLHGSKEDMQQYGSAITYARRYTLQSLLCIPSEDDDGNAASGNKIIQKSNCSGESIYCSTAKPTSNTTTNKTVHHCKNANCKKEISEKVAAYSATKIGIPLCFDCQKLDLSEIVTEEKVE